MGKIIYTPDDRQNHPESQPVTSDDLEKFWVKLKMDFKMMLEGQFGKPPKRWKSICWS